MGLHGPPVESPCLDSSSLRLSNNQSGKVAEDRSDGFPTDSAGCGKPSFRHSAPKVTESNDGQFRQVTPAGFPQPLFRSADTLRRRLGPLTGQSPTCRPAGRKQREKERKTSHFVDHTQLSPTMTLGNWSHHKTRRKEADIPVTLSFDPTTSLR